MHEPLLGQAAKPARSIVLGLPLRPYSIGHETQLYRCGNPLVHSALGLRSDLEEAVLVCSQKWEEFDQVELYPWLRVKLWLWERRSRKLPLERELRAFAEYREAGSLEFRLSEVVKPRDGGPARLPGAPFALRLQQFLMRELGLSESAAWDYPYGLAKMRWAAHWEQEGGLEIYNAHEASIDRYVAEEQAKAKDKDEVKNGEKKGGPDGA